jgi:hypothetical protein
MNNSTQTLIRSLFKILAGYLAAKGLASDDQVETISAGFLGLVAIIWGLVHRTSGTAAQPVSINRVSVILGFAMALPFLFSACSSPSKSHVYMAAGTGTSLGINQNPATQAYELGAKRAQIGAVILPVWANPTNGTMMYPETSFRYEIVAKSGVFGNAGMTWTFATGDKSVQTLLGGNSPPINQGMASNNPVNIPH